MNLSNPLGLDIITEYDEKGIPWKWYYVVEQMEQDGPGALDLLFEYYQEFNSHFDPWLNYLLACSYFSDRELNFPENRRARRYLEQKVQKLLKKCKKDISINEFLSTYKSELTQKQK
jgi:hypothetical protein